MTAFLSEFIGTALLMTLGNGVVANVVLDKTKGNNSGWIVIAFGWAIAVFVGVYTATASGAHLNPAITIGDAVVSGNWDKLATYIPAQFLGAMAGTTLVWLAYKQHLDETTNADLQLAVFCNAPAIRNTVHNFITEVIGTFVLMFSVLMLSNSKASVELGPLSALPVALLVLGIGLSLGGPTGYAINPARDLGPRIMHFILPIKNKRDSDWGYSWIPVVAPIVGAVLAALVKKAIE
ncbi:MAG: aquaporin family protein [Ferruginibacter sp.]|nr:aquaporin family protein [Ferruginibacter sp.]